MFFHNLKLEMNKSKTVLLLIFSNRTERLLAAALRTRRYPKGVNDEQQPHDFSYSELGAQFCDGCWWLTTCKRGKIINWKEESYKKICFSSFDFLKVLDICF
jgi:hypothetical protein